MIRLIAINNPRVAQAFIDYMASRQIEIDMMPEGEGNFALWLKDGQYQIEAESELSQFLDNPTASKYQAASWDMAESRTRQFNYPMPSFLAMIKSKAGPVTLIVMLLSIVVYALLQFSSARAVLDLLHFPAYEGQKFELWRWVSHAILHFSATHIIFNLLWWWQFGGDIEQRIGSGKLVQIFMVSAALSGAGQFWVEGANFGGLSGVVYALMGYLWMLTIKAPQKGLIIQKPIIGFMLVWLVLGYVQPFMAIANTAHLVGLLSGVGLGLFDAQRFNSQNTQS